MKLEIDEREILESAISKHLPIEKLEKLAAEILRERMELLTAVQAQKLLKVGPHAFRTLNLPIVFLTDKKRRYRSSDVEAVITKYTAQLAK